MKRHAALFAGLLACGTSEPRTPLPFAPAGPSATPDPSAMGPYPVGVRTVRIIDGARLDPKTREPRLLLTEIWYPAVEASRGQPGASYGLEDIVPAQFIPPGGSSARVQTVAVRDAPIYDDDTVFPLVVFSHGSGSIRLQSTFFTAVLASHGYVVAAPDHVGNTLGELIVQGSLDEGALLSAYDDRPLDVSRVIDWLASVKGDPLTARVDTRRVGLAGHSFGALTAIRTLGLEPRIAVSVAQAPPGYNLSWGGNERDLSRVGVPVMLQVGGVDKVLPPAQHATTLWQHMGAPRFELTLRRAGHFTFSDLCELSEDAIEAARLAGIDATSALRDGCSADNVSREIALPVIRHFGIALINSVLRDSVGSAALITEAEAKRLGGDEAELVTEP